jgi:glutamyl-tRNA synthetase
LDAKAAAQATPEARALVATLARTLADMTDWTSEALEAAVRGLAEARGLKLGAVAQPLRAALTGSTVSPGLFDVMMVLGRTEVLGRLGDFAGVMPD